MTDTSLIDQRAEELILGLIHEGIFEVSSEGCIWRLAEVRSGVVKKLPNKRRAEYLSSNGYLRLRVSINGVRLRVSAHRIVYRWAHGDIPDGHVVNHKNRIRTYNRPSNLEAMTQSQNVRHALEMELPPYMPVFP